MTLLTHCVDCEGRLIFCDGCDAGFCGDCGEGQRGGDFDGAACPAVCPACCAESDRKARAEFGWMSQAARERLEFCRDVGLLSDATDSEVMAAARRLK